MRNIALFLVIVGILWLIADNNSRIMRVCELSHSHDICWKTLNP